MSKTNDELEKLKRLYCPGSCDGKGTYVGGVDQDGDPEPAQCQWCFEVGMPLQALITKREQEVLQPFADAINNKGSHLDYHDNQLARLKYEWPTLYKLLEELKND
jgi:hypothetical protein